PSPSNVTKGIRLFSAQRADTVGVAQLVERQTVALDVAGSNPVTHPKHPHARPMHPACFFSQPASITMLRRVVANSVELRPAAGTESAPSHQPGLDRVKNPFPRRTKSFFCGANRRSG